ncbi:MAG: right-handed parallel beta-helix repeat-containing protein [Thermoplasmata archaeon]
MDKKVVVVVAVVVLLLVVAGISAVLFLRGKPGEKVGEKPSAPRNLQAVAGNQTVRLSWQPPDNDGGSAITNYKVYRGTTSGNLAFLKDVGNVLTYTDTGLTNGQTYYYQVSAVNGVGEGPRSNEVSATPFSATSHTPIHINGNSEFTAANGVVSGSGTESDPYIIEGWEINANGGSYGIWIENTTAYFVIRNCNVYGATDWWNLPGGAGIALNNVTHGTLDSNKCNNSRYGIYLYGGSQYNNITNNNAFGNSVDGIYLKYSTNNNITNNNASGNSWTGISLEYSRNNALSNNILRENGIVIGGPNLEHWNTHNIDTSNLVNGKPVYYYKNLNGVNVPSDAGQVILANCSNMVVSGLSISNASIAILLGFSNYNTITNNNASGNSWDGIYLYSSSTNNITNNNASGNSRAGIYLWWSSTNNITNNNASGNSWDGIYLCDSSNNTITNNNASGNKYGIYLDFLNSNNIITYNWLCNNANYGVYITYGSTGNIIHHNNFIGNRATALRYLSQGGSEDTPNGAGKGVNGQSQAYDSGGGNSWYDTTTSEGNYWSNWDGSGAYPIDGGAGASDPYPLSNPVGLVIPDETLDLPSVVRGPALPHDCWRGQGRFEALDSWDSPHLNLYIPQAVFFNTPLSFSLPWKFG